jgi:hypothetical protein
MPKYRYIVGECLGFEYGQEQGNHPMATFKNLKSAIKYAKFVAQNHIGNDSKYKIKRDKPAYIYQIYNKKTKTIDETYSSYVSKIIYFHSKVPKKIYEEDIMYEY